MTIYTYLSSEGFEERQNGTYVSSELNVTILRVKPDFYNLTHNDFTYKEIHKLDIKNALDCIHKYTNSSLVVALYNLQMIVKANHVLPLKEDF